MKILIVDDQLQFRENLLLVCSAEPKFELIAMADTCQEAIEATSLLTPDFIFFDERLLDDCSLTSVIDKIRDVNPQVKIIFLSEHPSEENLLRAYQLGSLGYLLKGSDFINLLPAILDLKPGEFMLSPRLAQMAVESLRDFRGALGVSEINRLTSREKEVLHQLCSGFSNREIAQNLVISENTVRIHVQNLLKKLNLQHRRQVQEKYGLFDGVAYSAVYASTDAPGNP